MIESPSSHNTVAPLTSGSITVRESGVPDMQVAWSERVAVPFGALISPIGPLPETSLRPREGRVDSVFNGLSPSTSEHPEAKRADASIIIIGLIQGLVKLGGRRHHRVTTEGR